MFSDGSCRVWRLLAAKKKKANMKPETKITPISKAEAKKLIKRAQRNLKVKELR